MPFLPFFDPLQEQRNKQNSEQIISGGSTTVNQAAQNISAPKPVQRSGSWTNLNSYLDANKDNAETLGNNIASNISNVGTQARAGIQNSQNDFNSMVDKNTIANLSGAKEDSDRIIKQSRENSFDNQINDNQVNRFKEVSNASYKGPQSLDGSQYYQETQGKLNKAKDYQANAQSDEGRFSLLQEMFNRPTYSQGQKNLDNLLLSGNSNAKNSVKSAADGLGDLQGNWIQAQNDAQALAAQRAADTNSAKQYAVDGVTKNRNERTNEVQSRLDDVNNHWADEYNNYSSFLSKFGGGDLALNKEQASKLGVNNSTGIYNLLNGVNPKAYLKLNEFDPNKVISKNEQAQLSALDKLAKQAGLADLNKYTDASVAETQNIDDAFDGSGFGATAKQSEKDFQNYAKNATITGSGTGKASYDNNMFDRGEITRTTTLSQNLADYLQGLGASMDGSSSDNPDLSGYLYNPTVAMNGSLFGGDLGGGKGGAEGSASYYAQKNAAENLYRNLLNTLDAQGYKNRIKVDNPIFRDILDEPNKSIPIKNIQIK